MSEVFKDETEDVLFYWKLAHLAASGGDWFEVARRLEVLKSVTVIPGENDSGEAVCLGYRALAEYGIDEADFLELERQATIEMALFCLEVNRRFRELSTTAEFRRYAARVGEPIEFFGTDEEELSQIDAAYQAGRDATQAACQEVSDQLRS